MPHFDSNRRLRFGDFELDLAAYELRLRGKPVRLERRPMDLLILLAERGAQLVSRDEIVMRLWGDGVFVDVETGINTAIRKVRQALNDSTDSPSFVETVSGKGYRFIAQITEAPTVQASSALSPQGYASGQGRVMLAVLPFENLSNTPDQEYFGDGLTEETISYLGQIDAEGMGVIARTTSMAYKGTRKSIREIGAELHVDYVLESSVRREGNRVRITAQLIRVDDQTHLWASTFDRELTGILAIQHELGTAIADHVRLHLAPGRLDTRTFPRTASAEAYDLYLRGRYFWHQLSAPTTQRAIEFYTRATELDPHYALAWSGLADAYATGPISGDAPPLVVWSKARDATARAIQSAPELAETQTSVGYLKFWMDWDWTAAEAAFQKAININPSYSVGHRMVGIVLSHMGRREESTAAATRARELDPLNAGHHALSAQVAFAARDYAAALQFSKQAIAIDPEFWVGYMQLGQAYEQLNQPDLALEALNHAGRLSNGNSKTLGLRAYIFAKMGKRAEAKALLGTLEAAARERYVPPYAWALAHVGFEEREIALPYLERALAVHDVHLSFLGYDPKWDPLRSDARFTNLLARCAFTQTASRLAGQSRKISP